MSEWVAATTAMTAVDATTVTLVDTTIATAADETEAARPVAQRTSRRHLHRLRPRDATDVNTIHRGSLSDKFWNCFVCKDFIVDINFMAKFFKLIFAGVTLRKDIHG